MDGMRGEKKKRMERKQKGRERKKRRKVVTQGGSKGENEEAKMKEEGVHGMEGRTEGRE
jgi:hypothetical protein